MSKRVWIELDHPDGMSDAEAQENCAAVNRMLYRLHKSKDVENTIISEFFWNETKQCYCFGGPQVGFVECGDKGQWFNLDYFGRVND